MSPHDHAPVDMQAIALSAAKSAERVAKAVHGIEPLPVRVRECELCWRGYKDNGDKCFNCAGLGRIASDGGEV